MVDPENFLPHMDPEVPPRPTCPAAGTGSRGDPSLAHDREQSQSNLGAPHEDLGRGGSEWLRGESKEEGEL